MCGRYVLVLRPSSVRTHLLAAGLPVDSVCVDSAVKSSYNIAPGYTEPVYLSRTSPITITATSDPQYTIRPMKWGSSSLYWLPHNPPPLTAPPLPGLIPSWHIGLPDPRPSINCRADSLASDTAFWRATKQRNRCVVPAEGFYEWLASSKQPHYVKRADERLMLLAGLWDYDSAGGCYTFTIVTTVANEQLSFLHERMPVILEPDAVRKWIDPGTTRWGEELQALLTPFGGELTVYPVAKEVGKVGCESAVFVEPVRERRDGIRRFLMSGRGEGDDDEGTKEEPLPPPPPPPPPLPSDLVQQPRTAGGKRKASDDTKDIVTSPLAKTARLIKSPLSKSPKKPSPKKKKTATDPAAGNRKITSFFVNERNGS